MAVYFKKNLVHLHVTFLYQDCVIRYENFHIREVDYAFHIILLIQIQLMMETNWHHGFYVFHTTKTWTKTLNLLWINVYCPTFLGANNGYWTCDQDFSLFFYKQMLRGCENLICAKAFNRQKSVESLFVGKQGFVISAMVINIEN